MGGSSLNYLEICAKRGTDVSKALILTWRSLASLIETVEVNMEMADFILLLVFDF